MLDCLRRHSESYELPEHSAVLGGGDSRLTGLPAQRSC